MSEKTELGPNFKLWLEKEGEPIIGKGRVELLQTIEREGSLNKAAEIMNMSYRHLWGTIKKLEERLGYDLVKTIKGGKEGGGATLTEEAYQLIEEYKRLNKTIKTVIEERSP
ncbi:hypothetical protein AKJ63_01155 [candidate division MSBL1 archaeon SCGC-AAA259D18]|uniref:HTH lysR-type domain-containing protein n=1 Tax=candidate division MSBL1 archaeon SCGC-AAA259D18 TaxID=1698262 RepID=A0A133UBP7_9EURY|nr:hypothetical protein AKJ63_01155 [candidate division MSBL1 archaeon SCGC-AAA259D18]